MQAHRKLLPDGRRWHFQHGPIDLVIGADGDATAIAAAHEAAWQRFEGVLAELVGELPLLRRRVMGPCPLQGTIARRMWWACRPFHSEFITPMAAVAGAVAQEIIAFYERPGIARAWVNNGGDIALHLAQGESVKVGVVADASDPLVATDASFAVTSTMPVRGIATSGWRGRSFSLGIADSVTILAKTAAQADAAATIVANAVDVDDPRIARCPASTLKDDTDLGDIPVTVAVPPLPDEQLRIALERGRRRALELQHAGLIHSALLACQQRYARIEPIPAGDIGVDPDIARRQVGSVFA
ncbi:MAG TPA: UPF0280 family protein [Burkholderiaceae bacterium]|nr:UPF0280 family protein [Burkholderiaceae bacterium]